MQQVEHGDDLNQCAQLTADTVHTGPFPGADLRSRDVDGQLAKDLSPGRGSVFRRTALELAAETIRS